MGCSAGWFRYAGYILNPIIEAIRPIPALAYIPLVIVWVGIDEPAQSSGSSCSRCSSPPS